MDWAIGILIDVILVLIIVICAKKGNKDGFAKTLVSFFGFFIALVLAAVVCTPAAEFCYDKAVSGAIQTETQKVLDNSLDGYSELGTDTIGSAIDGAVAKLPGFIKGLVNTEKIKEGINENIDGTVSGLDTAQIAQRINEKIVRPALISIFAAIFFAVVFVVCLIICKILAKSLKLVNKIPLLGKVNGFLGGLLGLLKGIVFVLLINWIIVYLVNQNGNLFGIITVNTINSSLITNFLSKVSPLNIVFSKIF